MTGTILVQSRPSDTSNTQVYSPSSGITTEITRILVCNTTGSGDSFRVFLDQDGSTYDQTTALFYDESLAANTTREISGSWWMDNADGNLAVRVATGSAITFTFFGVEHQK